MLRMNRISFIDYTLAKKVGSGSRRKKCGSYNLYGCWPRVEELHKRKEPIHTSAYNMKYYSRSGNVTVDIHVRYRHVDIRRCWRSATQHIRGDLLRSVSIVIIIIIIVNLAAIRHISSPPLIAAVHDTAVGGQLPEVPRGTR